MATSVNEPMLNNHRADLIRGQRAGVRKGAVPGFRAFHGLTSPFRLDHARSLRGMHEMVGVALKPSPGEAV
jgi:hypothetical protein